ncbi:acetyl-CoA carboxylase biotin carboxyl carrier protein subunit [Flavobacterium psychrotolerans]|uniref:Acetyl-CoA carboxylase biotin carboxyl carrier protein subunit n=1 Tax=Flavobacterium psychrotolerans TaxID=2169410 RepID=A0A2U1JRA6_9FLAO|nr:acetyl-CoA carboxylase biotin carboxyl carrier protein subunit [Flavobacterium psychrotolerans]PWA07413.1 acetyl-CoA carboxylase biotin carboxyl carrier protein subunit [Flavobacterium psychrotolerans]
MSKDFKVNVNTTFQFDYEKESIPQLDAVSIETNKFHILHQNKPYKAEIISSNFNQKCYTIKVNHNTYSVTISNKLDMLIMAMGFEVGATKHVNTIKAPMPGLILEIFVVVGQSVKENDNILILGAMKMENSFLSPRDGVIKSISVIIGDAVVKGQLLIEFE